MDRSGLGRQGTSIYLEYRLILPHNVYVSFENPTIHRMGYPP
jgi:hypothetical protein